MTGLHAALTARLDAIGQRAAWVIAGEGTTCTLPYLLGTDVPALVAALRAVLDLHHQDEQIRAVDGGPERITVVLDRCGECHEEGWPCPTVRALAAALGVSP